MTSLIPMNHLDDKDIEFAIISYKYPAVIAQNILSLFGAADLYETVYRKNDKKIKMAKDLLPDDIMHGEIAQALGRRITAIKVYALLSRFGIRLIPKTKAQVCFPLVISREAMMIAETLASIEQADPLAVMADILEQALADCKRGRRAAE